MDYNTIASIKVAMCCVVIVLLIVRHFRRRSPVSARVETGTLAVLAVLAVAVFFHFGWFHTLRSNSGWGSAKNYVHHWDCFHYYVGSKYFSELGYYGLYEAAAVADAESERFLNPRHSIRNLRNYQAASVGQVLARTAAIKAPFSPARWASFKHDVSYFKNGRGKKNRARTFRRVLNDHGYNPTPIWNQTGRIVSNLIPVEHILLISLLDVPLWILAFVLIARTFGVRAMLLGVTFFCIEYIASSFLWVGGSFVRADWLVCLIGAFCALHVGRYGWAGALLVYAATVRIFPMLFLFGLAVKALVAAREQKRIPRNYVRLFAAFSIGGALLVGYGTIGGGVDTWKGYLRNISLHNAHVSDNAIGLERVLNVDTDLVFNNQEGVASQNNGLNLLLSLLTLLLLVPVVRHLDDGHAFLWGTVPSFALLNLSCYYYSFLVIWVAAYYAAPIDRRRTSVLIGLFALQILGHLTRANLYDNTLWYRSFFYISAAFVAAFVVLGTSEVIGRRRAALAE